MKEYKKLPKHPYLSKEQKKIIKEKFNKLPHHKKVKAIKSLLKYIENPENQEENMNGEDYRNYLDDVVGILTIGQKKVELAIAVVGWIISWFT